jgi:hypothetical protein
MRKLTLPEQSWPAEEAEASEVKVVKNDQPETKPVDPAQISLGYARI